MYNSGSRGSPVSRVLIPIAAGFILGALLLWLALGLQSQQALADIDNGVLIDPGHGGEDVGAIAPDSGVYESELNLAVALALKDALTEGGIKKVDLTRSDENALGPTKDADMQERARIISSTEAAIMVSIHMNSFPSDTAVKGPQVFYQTGDTTSMRLAQAIQHRLDAAAGTDRGIQQKDLFVLRNATVPAVLVECGFLTNPEEDKLLQQQEYQRVIAGAIADGIADYCG
ncbi:MAG: N-acetylmuramoyl-L-alanine amidase [Bacillota bacterium]